jgi:hypothetical protein
MWSPFSSYDIWRARPEFTPLICVPFPALAVVSRSLRRLSGNRELRPRLVFRQLPTHEVRFAKFMPSQKEPRARHSAPNSKRDPWFSLERREARASYLIFTARSQVRSALPSRCHFVWDVFHLAYSLLGPHLSMARTLLLDIAASDGPARLANGLATGCSED